MNEFRLGTYIKKRREELKMSQEELCEGLCAVSSLSRIENNQQDPSRNLTKNLLERLGIVFWAVSAHHLMGYLSSTRWWGIMGTRRIRTI